MSKVSTKVLSNVKIWFGDPAKAKDALDYLETLGYDAGKNSIRHDIPNQYMGGFVGDSGGWITYIQKDDRYYFENHAAKEVFLPTIQAPIGLRPKAIVDALRIKEILEAMVRYSDDGKQIPQEWLDELSIINSEKV